MGRTSPDLNTIYTDDSSKIVAAGGLKIQTVPVPFQPIHYLGSKLRMVRAIGEVIDRIDPSKGLVCDLFAGSGTVANYLSYSRPVLAADIQEYSRVLCSALLSPPEVQQDSLFDVDQIKSSERYKLLHWAVEPLQEYELSCLSEAFCGDSLALCELVENGSLISFQQGFADNVSSGLVRSLKEVSGRLNKLGFLNGNQAMILRYYGGLYFSYEQAVQVDALLHYIAQKPKEFRDTLLAAVLSIASDVVNTVGKQFAQPIRPRGSDGLPKSNIHKSIAKDRSIDIFSGFNDWLIRYSIRPQPKYHSEAFRGDYADILKMEDRKISVIYADPPYTRDHYSRFYHVLETICLRDNPSITHTTVHGKEKLARGIYRDDRYQSPFCIKSKALDAFEGIFRGAKAQGANLVLSYSPYTISERSHPRLLTIEQLILLGSKYFGKVSVESPGEFSHSKLNKTALHLASPKNAEVLIIYER